jgi:hypothetical protein
MARIQGREFCASLVEAIRMQKRNLTAVLVLLAAPAFAAESVSSSSVKELQASAATLERDVEYIGALVDNGLYPDIQARSLELVKAEIERLRESLGRVQSSEGSEEKWVLRAASKSGPLLKDASEAADRALAMNSDQPPDHAAESYEKLIRRVRNDSEAVAKHLRSMYLVPSISSPAPVSATTALPQNF